MGRRKKEDSAPETGVAVNVDNDAYYIIQPTELTMLKGYLSPLEIDIFVEVVDSMQDRLKKQRDELMSGKQLSLFDFNDEVIQIPLSKFNVLPCDYWRLDDAAKKLSAFKIFHRFKDELGNWVDGYSTLFPDAGISKTSIKADGTAYKYKNGSRTVGYMRISVNKTLAPRFLNINKEWTRYMKKATRGCRCRYTPRMVMFISTYREKGLWQIEYNEFRRLIGLLYNDEVVVIDEVTGRPKKRVVECEMKGYSKFSDVKRRILDPAKEEMKDMCDKRALDCYFEYEPIYPGGKNRGVPDSIIFHIHKGPLGLEDDAAKRERAKSKELGKYLSTTFGMASHSVRTLVAQVTDANRDAFMQKAQEIAAYIQKQGNISSPSGYAYTALVEYLNEAAAIRDKSQTSAPAETDKTNHNTPNAENVCNLSPNEEPKEINGRWDGALGEMQLNIQSKDMEYILSDLQYVSFEGDVLTLSTPPGNKFFEQWITQQWNYREQYLAAVRSHFGENVRVVYVMRKF